MATLTLKSKFSDVWGAFRALVNMDYTYCRSIVDYFDQIAQTRASFGDAIDAIPVWLDGRKSDDFCAHWLLDNFGDEFDREVVEKLLGKIHDPGRKFQIWKSCLFLTEEDKTSLRIDWEMAYPETKKRIDALEAISGDY